MLELFFLKPDLQPGGSGGGGGHHLFRCAARALAAAGHTVHLLHAATKQQLLLEVMQHGAMASLQFSAAVEGCASWTEPGSGLVHHCSLADRPPSEQQKLAAAMAGLGGSGGPPALSPVLQRLVDQVTSLARQQQPAPLGHDHAQRSVVLDADGSQAPAQGGAASLMEAASAAWGPARLLVLVQNIHFTPLGPQGTAPPAAPLLAAWGRVGGVLCVSSFVARYVLAHAASLGLPPGRVCVVHPAAFGAFGRPGEDAGAAAAAQAAAAAAAQQLPWPGPHQDQQPGAPPPLPPTIGCLKLTPEKGGALFLQLAAALPQLRFLAVCTHAGIAAAASALPNMELVAPVEDEEGGAGRLLGRMTLLLAPSVWAEAYGLVVTEALLRGVPVLVSDQGGLQEAALGCAAAVLPVQPLELPPPASAAAAAGGGPYPRWAARRLPEQQPQAVVEAWASAIQRLLADREAYLACSAAGRAAAERLVQHQQQLLAQAVDWVRQQAAQHA